MLKYIMLTTFLRSVLSVLITYQGARLTEKLWGSKEDLLQTIKFIKNINPFTALACTISGLKSARIHVKG